MHDWNFTRVMIRSRLRLTGMEVRQLFVNFGNFEKISYCTSDRSTINIQCVSYTQVYVITSNHNSFERIMLFKALLTSAFLVSSVSAFNGQAPASFAPKKTQSETVLRMSGGNAAPALKVRQLLKLIVLPILLLLIFILHYTAIATSSSL